MSMRTKQQDDWRGSRVFGHRSAAFMPLHRAILLAQPSTQRTQDSVKQWKAYLFTPAFWLLALLLPQFTAAQSGIGDSVYTVGTVARDAHGQDWAYVLWQATEPGLNSNRVFAVYAKPGDASSVLPYSRTAIVRLQTDARVI